MSPDYDPHADLLRAREALRASEERFRLLVESVQDYAIILLDPAGHVLTWNTGAERIKGYEAHEIIGQHFSRFYRPEDAAAGACDRLLERAASEGRAESETWRVRKDGSLFWANVILTALRDPAGTLVGYAKVTRDLTERRKAEVERIRLAQVEEANRLKDEFLEREQSARRAAEEARSSLATTLRSIGDAVIATDDRGHVTLMNPVAERLTGWPLSDARGRPLRDVFHIVHEHTRRVVESPVDRVLREGVVVGLANHTVLLARGGPEVPISDSGAPIRDDSGALRGVVLVFRDASEERKIASQRDFLAEAAGILSSSLDHREPLSRLARLAVPWLCDYCSIDVVEQDGRLAQVAVAHLDPHKLEIARALRGRYPLDPSAPSGIPNVVRTGRPEHAPEVTAELLASAVPDPERRSLVRDLQVGSYVIVPLLAGPRVLGALTLVLGAPGRRYTADDVAFAEELGRRIATAIENARLYAAEQRARDLADAASRAKDEFLALVSHELRTPLSAILGWAKILTHPGADQRKRERALETIERNAVAMAQLVEDLLDVSRIVAGKLRLEMTRVHLAAVIEAALDSVKHAADARSITISLDLDPGAPPIRADAARLQQVVWNLLSNAVKFTPPGGRVSVSLARLGSHLEITVSDTGRGIEPRFLPHVFDPFRQADGGLTRATGGLGLGLAIVKRLVELHGGTVDARSGGPGRGATFTVRLPFPLREPAQRGSPVPASEPAERRSVPSPHLAGLRVLLVEDEPDMRELLGEVLAEAGCQVTAARSVAEAVRAFEEGRIPDVLISDIGMPSESGYDLIRFVRSLPPDRGGQVPAAALTAYTRAEDRQQVLGAGFEMHMPKPIEPAELVRTVAALARFADR